MLCRAGICAEDFEAHTGELRAACYARDARVTRNRRWSQLVTIDIIRRDTLAASEHDRIPPGAADRALPRQLALVPDDEHKPAANRHGGPGLPPGAARPRPPERRHLP